MIKDIIETVVKDDQNQQYVNSIVGPIIINLKMSFYMLILILILILISTAGINYQLIEISKYRKLSASL